MVYVIVSDLHMGVPGDPATDFHQGSCFATHLKNWHDEGWKIVMNGDCEELWQFEQTAVEDANPRVCQAIEDYAYVIIRGNHDDVPTICGRSTIEFLRVGKYLKIMHGREFDPFNSPPWTWVGRTVSWAAGVLERVVHADVDEKLERWIARRLKRGRYADFAGVQRYERLARKHADEIGVERIVLGHTHKRVYAPCARYMNSGTWTDGQADKVVLEV